MSTQAAYGLHVPTEPVGLSAASGLTFWQTLESRVTAGVDFNGSGVLPAGLVLHFSNNPSFTLPEDLPFTIGGSFPSVICTLDTIFGFKGSVQPYDVKNGVINFPTGQTNE